MEYDFSGWATRNNLLCSDGRTIRKGAFQHQDGTTVPLVWAHDHKGIENIVGHALLENRDEGVYAYCSLNDTKNGVNAKKLVEHGDITSLSIYANKLQQKGNDVMHGVIRELSLVMAGANPGAYIDTVISHEDGADEEAIMFVNGGFDITISHEDTAPKEEPNPIQHEDPNETVQDVFDKMGEKKRKVAYFIIAQVLSNPEAAHSDAENDSDLSHAEGGETVEDVWKTFSPKEQKVVLAIIAMKMSESNENTKEMNHEEESNMHHNVFDESTAVRTNDGVLTHADQEEILRMAKSSRYGSLQDALNDYCAEHEHLQHGFDEIETLFPEYKTLGPAAPEMITSDQSWIAKVMGKVSKSPYTRVKTRQMDVKSAGLRSLGYQKGKLKKEMGNVKLLKRTTDPQTIYVRDSLDRDDILDVTDFDIVAYNQKLMRMNLNEEIALAVLVSDMREDGDPDKISEEHVRSIYHDDELYCIHKEVDLTTAKTKLQGTDTASYFGDEFVFAEAMIEASLDSRIDYRGSGNLDFYCTPRTLNKMLLARDRNGHRMFSSKNDLAAALNVASIQTVEQLEGVSRSVETSSGAKTKELYGILVNMSDYQIGAAKGGEITSFNQFDIKFNKEEFLMETRISGALTRIKSAIVLETPAA